MNASTPDPRPLPLHGLRVVTVVDDVLPALGKILADLGARVDVVTDGPVAVTDEVAHLIAGRGKRFVDSADALPDLLPTTDVLICGPSVGGRHHTAIAAAHPELVVAVLTEFGLTGDRADWLGTEAVHQALGGTLARSGEPGRPPLLPPGELFRSGAAQAIAYSILAAVYRGLRGDRRRGAVLDCAVFEHGTVCLDPAQGMTGSGTPDYVAELGRPDAGNIYPVFKVADGYVRVCVLAVTQWDSLLDWMGRPAELLGDDLRTNPGRYARAADLVVPAMAAFFAPLTVAQMVRECGERRIPAAEVLAMDGVLTEPHFREVGVLAQAPGPDGRTMTFPEGLVRIDGTRCAAPTAPADEDRIAPAGEEVRGAGLLAGLTVLDLGVIVAGAQTGQMLAELGARVIRIENTTFPDGMRRSFESLTPALARGHMGKENLGLNLRSPEGLAVFRELVAAADVVCSNFKPGTTAKLGIAHDDLAAINPRIITIESSAFGDIGSRRSAMGYGPLVRALTGLSWLWREDTEAEYFGDGITIYPDHLAGGVAGTAIAACLIDRLRTGVGARIVLGQCDIGLVHLATQVARESLAPGTVLPPGATEGALLRRQVFPTRGTEQWCVIDPRTPAQVRAMREALGIGEHVADLEDAIAATVADRDKADVAERLQAAGVPAAPMLGPTDLPGDVGLATRDFYTTTSVSGTDLTVGIERAPLVVDGARPAPIHPAPAFGEHTRALLAELGRTPDEIESLFTTGAIEESTLAAQLHRDLTESLSR